MRALDGLPLHWTEAERAWFMEHFMRGLDVEAALLASAEVTLDVDEPGC